MSNLEVLLVTTKKQNEHFITEMNLQSNIVIANQTNNYSYNEKVFNGNLIKFICTNTIGVGTNRNIALMHASADYCLLADDDEIFYTGYKQIILSEFAKYPDADVLIFNVNMLKDNSKNKFNAKKSKVNYFNFSNYGAVRIAFKRESILRKNIWFTSKFGGGTEFSSGEDSLFIKEALDKKLNIYTVPYTIADVKEEESSWFRGYNEKYFYDKGAYLSLAAPKLKWLYMLYFSWKFQRYSEFDFWGIYRLIKRGIKEY